MSSKGAAPVSTASDETCFDARITTMESAEKTGRERNSEMDNRTRRVQEHTEQAALAIEKALDSIQEIRKQMGYPFIRSTRLEENGDAGSVDRDK